MKPFKLLVLAVAIFGTSVLAPRAQDNGLPGLVPDCSLPDAKADQDFPGYPAIVCASDTLMAQAKKIEESGNALLKRLPAVWQPAFAAHQQAFPAVANNCSAITTNLRDCIGKLVTQRISDIAVLAHSLDADLPVCAASHMTVTDSGWSEAGMSHLVSVYRLTYSGETPCQLRGFPAARLFDAAKQLQWTSITYASTSGFAGPPLPVILSPSNQSAWFSLSTSSACGPGGVQTEFALEIAAPLSQTVLAKLSFPAGTCNGVIVGPIGMMSMAYAVLG